MSSIADGRSDLSSAEIFDIFRDRFRGRNQMRRFSGGCAFGAWHGYRPSRFGVGFVASHVTTGMPALQVPPHFYES
jgi:hypothetical protein